MELIAIQDVMFGTHFHWWFVFEGIVTLWLIQIWEINNRATKVAPSQLSRSVQLSG